MRHVFHYNLCWTYCGAVVNNCHFKLASQMETKDKPTNKQCPSENNRKLIFEK